MNILVFNCGSSSLKYRLIGMPQEAELVSGEAQRVGSPTAQPARIVQREDGSETTHTVDMPNHDVAFEKIMGLLQGQRGAVADGIAHRMVHGGELYRDPVLVDQAFLKALEGIADLAPLHNPPAIRLIRACHRLCPELPQVVVFDTAYHASIPEYAYTYGLPRRLREELGLRKYGFHGISHEYVVAEAARFLKRPLERFNAVSCHLGSGGASLCAVRNGRSIDNTMGYSPLQGLIMSTRCGDLDPAVTLQLLARNNGDLRLVEAILNRQSGVLGLCGESADIRDVLAEYRRAGRRDSRWKETAWIYLWRLRKYLGAFLATLGSADAVIFTDTIGEESPEVRFAMCAGMNVFGLEIDAGKNDRVSDLPADISAAGSDISILVVRTNEERAIARNAYKLLHADSVAALERAS